MDEYVSRVEYDERQKRIDDENRRQNHRIDKLETLAEQLADMAASIKGYGSLDARDASGAERARRTS